MKKKGQILMMTSILIMAVIWGFIALEKGTDLFKGLDLVIFILIVVLAVIAFMRALKKEKELEAGFPAEDELSMRIKYKSGYHAYMASMYMWLFIFLLKDHFPDIETMLGGGILLSAFIGFVSTMIVKNRLHA